MSAPKNPPAKKTGPKVTEPAIDYTKLTVADAELPKSTRSSVLDKTPFVAWMTDSRDRKVAKTVTVPDAAVGQTTYLIRAAATRLGTGVRVVAADKDKSGNVKITFEASKKRARKTKDEVAADAAPAVETPAAETPAPVA